MGENTEHTGLLVMDMQSAILQNMPDPTAVIDRVIKAIAVARANEIPVLYIAVGFRQGAPDVSPKNKMFAANKERYASVNAEEWIKIHPSVAPLATDIIVIKRRVSAFSGSDLELILRARELSHLVLCGVATSGVVLSTLREAADKDYRITVLAEACADRDEEVHRVLTTKVFPRQADTLTIDEWSKTLVTLS